MGCLKSTLKIILFIAAVIAFFALGGYTFVKQKINAYQNPTRDEFVASETNYGDFSNISSDYHLTRSYNFFGYKKINAKYIPTGQKITIFDLKNEKRLTPEDLKTNEIDNKLSEILDKTKDSLITFEDFKITQRSTYKADGKVIPYVKYEAKVKNIPFKNVTGVIGAYSTRNKKAHEDSTKLIYTMVDKKAYNPKIVQDFVQSIRF